MKKTLVYLIGQPGSGKSTVTEELFGGLPSEASDDPIAHIVYPSAIQLGAKRESFSGTDAFPMNIQPQVVPFMKDSAGQLFFAEGDRLANDKFFTSCVAAGIGLRVFMLHTPNAVAAERRKARGSNQSTTWLKGRITKVYRLWKSWGDKAYLLDGTKSPAEIAEELMTHEVVRMMVRR